MFATNYTNFHEFFFENWNDIYATLDSDRDYKDYNDFISRRFWRF